jgi:predicted MFS family arabinose efflux permease
MQVSKVTWWTLLTNRDSFFALAVCAMGIFNLTFYQGFLTPELAQYGLDESAAGMVMSIISVSYLLGCLIYPRVFKSVPRKLQFLMSIMGFTLALLLMGPSLALNLPNELSVVLMAYPLLGIC